MDSASIKIFIARNGDRSGPFTLEEIDQKRATGEVNDNDYAWYEGQKNWIPLVQVPGLAPLAVPPPPPAATVSDPVLARWVTFFVLGLGGFIFLMIVIFVGIMLVCGVVIAAEAAKNHQTDNYAAGHAFGLKYGPLIWLFSASSALLVSGLLSWRLSFSNLFPWCRKN